MRSNPDFCQFSYFYAIHREAGLEDRLALALSITVRIITLLDQFQYAVMQLHANFYSSFLYFFVFCFVGLMFYNMLTLHHYHHNAQMGMICYICSPILLGIFLLPVLGWANARWAYFLSYFDYRF